MAGDDRSPSWGWMGCLYHDGKHVGIPSDNLMTMLREGGAKVPTGKKGATFKRQTQSGLLVVDTQWDIVTADGQMIAMKDVNSLLKVADFDEHVEVAKRLGFELHMKGARVGQSKHIRVRPIFRAGWTIAGTITILDDSIDVGTLALILECAGRYCGLGDWRPSAPKSPGPYGRFESEVLG